MMKSYYALAWKEIKAQKVVSALILVAIIMSTMMTTVIGQSISILNTMRINQAALLNGNRYATFHGLSHEQANRIMSDSRLSYAEKIIFVGGMNMPGANLSLQVREYRSNALTAYDAISQLEAGRLPAAPFEIALPQDALSMLGFQGVVGDTITLDMSVALQEDIELPYEFTTDFVLTGILRPHYMGYLSGIISGIAGEGTAEQLLPERYLLYSVDIRVYDRGMFQNTVDSIVHELSLSSAQVQYIHTLLSVLGIRFRYSDIDTGFSAVAVSGVLIGGLVLLAAGLVVFNILKIAVTKRIKEYGVLRAIGAEKGKLYSLVALQLAILCIVGIPAGILLGVLSTRGITIAATNLFSPEIFIASTQAEIATWINTHGTNQIFPLIISMAITIIFAFAAAIPAARYAGAVSPVVSMTGKSINIKRKNRKTKRIRNFNAYYARLNMGRNRGRTAITIGSLVMSIAVFIVLQGFSGLLDASIEIQQMRPGDYVLTNELVGFSPEVVEEIRQIEGIASVSTLKHQLYAQNADGELEIDTDITLQPHETLLIAGVDEQRLRTLANLTEQDLQALKSGRAVIMRNPLEVMGIPPTLIGAGEVIEINSLSLNVIAVTDELITLDSQGVSVGVQIIVYDSVFDMLTGIRNTTEIYINLSPETDREATRQAITTISERISGTRLLSYEMASQQLQETFEQLRLLAWGLILFIGLIGVLNIINTAYTNIQTRITEIGVQRAIGMSNKSLYSTFLWEGLYYGLIAAVVGNVAGYVLATFANAAAVGIFEIITLPIASMLGVTVISVLACLFATCVPLKKIADMSIVAAIGTIE